MFKLINFLHHIRIITLGIVFVCLFGFLGINPIDVGKFLGAKVGQALSITTEANVPANPFNTAAAQLKDKEQKLAWQEENLSAREAALGRLGTGTNNNLVTFLFSGMVILFGLVVTNYFLDWRSRRILKNNISKVNITHA